MNRQMPPGNCGGGPGTLPGAVGLVVGIETDSTRVCTDEKRRRITRRPSMLTSGKSAANRVSALAIAAFEGLNLHARLLNQRAADESADAVSLPVGRLHDRFQCRPVLAAQHRDHGGFLAPVARCGGLRLGAGLLCR